MTVRNAYNNHRIGISSATDTLVKVDVEFGARGQILSSTIYPNPTNNDCEYNAKHPASKIVNRSNFADLHAYEVTDEPVVDPEAYINAHIVFDATLEGGTEVTEIDEVYIKGFHDVEQKGDYLTRGNSFYLHPKFNDKSYLRMWLGMPFDFAFYAGPIAFNFTIKFADLDYLACYLPAPQDNETEESFSFVVDPAVYRLTLSNGGGHTGLILPEPQTLEIILNEVSTMLLEVQEPICGGVYLKWHNQYGGWDYHMFNRHVVDNLNTSQIGAIQNDFLDVDKTVSPIVSTGKNRERTKLIYTTAREYEFEKMSSLVSSPKVYMYLAEPLATYSADNWAEVQINGGLQTKTRNRNKIVSFEVVLPTLTMSL